MSGDVCKTEQVTLQENGIVRDAEGRIIGRLVEDVDALCGEHNKRGYKQGYRAGKADAQRTWVGLTDEQIRKWWASENGMEDCRMSKLDDFAQVVRAIEAKLREKNT